MANSMRMLISLLVVSLFVIASPGLQSTASASSGAHAVQGRAKKKTTKPRPQKAKKAEKVDKKSKKNDPGFAF